MKIRDMRWGYDGGGVACGPVEGNTIVEICVTEDDKHNYFVLVNLVHKFRSICERAIDTVHKRTGFTRTLTEHKRNYGTTIRSFC